MKRIGWIGILVLLALAACQRHDDNLVETRFIASPTVIVSPNLALIDSLMWRQPDSALVKLLNYLDNDSRDVARYVPTNETFDKHYAHLLLAELLYKNDYAQTNRPALLQAVAYFDSLVRPTPPSPPYKGGRGIKKGAGGIKKDLNPNPNLAFLNARAHYINGVGYYENDSIVEACAEYLKALEMMESHFEEKDLIGIKAKFITYTYNRLTELFSDQFMMEPAIVCGEKALWFCMVEPVSSLGASRILYQIGKQYDEMKELDKAKQYYNRALESMTNTDNLVYRDIVTSKALCEYSAGAGMEQSLEIVRRVIIQADTEDEKLNRFLTLGGIFYEERVYDSAIKYLEPAFIGSNSMVSQIQAADYLRIIYDIFGDEAKADEFVRFLADHKKLEGEYKALVSKLGELFNSYLNQKQEKEAEEARKRDVKKAVDIIIIIAIMIALAILVFAKFRGKKMLEKQQEEAKEAFEKSQKQHELTLQRQQTESETLLEEKERQLEKERKARQREKEKLQQGLQQRDEQVSALEKALNQKREEAELRREAFMNEAICCKINNSIRSLRITARNSHEKYVSFTEEDATALKAAVLKHYGNFESVLLGKYPKLSNDDLQLCQLYLMGLDERQIAVLQNKSYSAIKKRANTLKDLMGLDENLQTYLLKFSSFL